MFFLKRLIHLLLDVVLPLRCPCCGVPTDGGHFRKSNFDSGGVCGECFGRIDWAESQKCSGCGHPFQTAYEIGESLCGLCLKENLVLDGCAFVAHYDHLTRELIMRFKHGHDFSVVPFLVKSLSVIGASYSDKIDYIVPVPLHWTKLMQRCFNQSALLARGVSQAISVPFKPFALIRKRKGDSQGHKTRQQRIENVRGLFKVPDKQKKVVQGKSVLLVDDVQTTGATLKACATALKNAGALKVYALSFARVVK